MQSALVGGGEEGVVGEVERPGGAGSVAREDLYIIVGVFEEGFCEGEGEAVFIGVVVDGDASVVSGGGFDGAEGG